MGDEEGAFGFERVDFDVGVWDRDALEIVEADVADLEGEEGGDGFAGGVAEVFDWLAGVGTADAASGDEELLGFVGLAEGGVDFEAVLSRFYIGGSAAGAPNDATFAGGVGEALDDRF